MKIAKSKDANENYLAKIVEIKSFEKHPNPEVTKLKLAHVDGFTVVVGIDDKPGLYIYFPTNSRINVNYLSFMNLFRDSSLNKDNTKKGFFNENGRVTAIKLKGVPSEGFLMPVSTLDDFLENATNGKIDEYVPGTEFDSIQKGDKLFWLVKKYIVPTRPNVSSTTSNRRNKKIKSFDKLVDGQFKFHYDTALLRKTPFVIQKDSLIQVTEKIHGTSGISAYLLCKKPINIFKRILNFVSGHGFKNYEYCYDYIYSSRSVVKNSKINKYVKQGYYKVDVWAYADKIVRPYLQKGMTLYYEIVGFLPTGGYIQKDYDYGCIPPETSESYKSEVNFKVRIYRVTTTNVDGDTHEWSAREVQQWCNKVGLTPVKELYYGYAKDMYPQMRSTVNFSTNFMNRLADDESLFMEKNSPSCNNSVPNEGIVIKIEDSIPHAFKLKCFAFLNKEQKELDNNVENIEDNA